MSYPNAPYNYHPPAHSPNNPFYHDPAAPTNPFSHPSAAGIPSQVDSTDAELLAEAQQHEQSHPPPPYESDYHEDAELEDSLSWIPAKNLPNQPQADHHPPLIVSIPLYCLHHQQDLLSDSVSSILTASCCNSANLPRPDPTLQPRLGAHLGGVWCSRGRIPRIYRSLKRL